MGLGLFWHGQYSLAPIHAAAYTLASVGFGVNRIVFKFAKFKEYLADFSDEIPPIIPHRLADGSVYQCHGCCYDIFLYELV